MFLGNCVIPTYQNDLMDGKCINCNEQAFTDMILITPSAKANLHDVILIALPGPPCPLLIGRVELACFKLPGMWELIEHAIRKSSYISDKALGMKLLLKHPILYRIGEIVEQNQLKENKTAYKV